MKKCEFRVIDVKFWELEEELNNTLSNYDECEIQATVYVPSTPNNLTVIMHCCKGDEI